MAQKKKKKEPVVTNIFAELKEETVRGVWGIVFLSITLFFIFAAFKLAGIAGEMTYQGLSYLFGIGYFLLPIVLFLIAVSFFRAIEHAYGPLKITSAVVFLLSGLGLINVAAPGRGGVVGSLIDTPLIALFDTYSTILVLVAITTLSLVILFDFLPTLASFSFLTRLFSKKDPDEDAEYDEEYDVETYVDGEEVVEEEDGEEVVEEEVADEEDEEKTGGIFGFGKKKPTINAYPVYSEYQAPPPLSLRERQR